MKEKCSAVAPGKLTLLALCVAVLPGCAALKQDYQQFDRTHSRKIDFSYDADSQTIDLGYTITPFGGGK